MVSELNKKPFSMMIKDFIRPKQLGLLEDYSDGLINIAEIKKGDRFYECNHVWGNIEIIALDDAKRTSDGWICRVRDRNNTEHDIFVSASTSHYGPDLYSKPQILDQNEAGELGYYVQ